ncbi:MAG: DUF4097 family beta strand repeat protein [Clostridia bacterium]|nr:DUF4097 family beta strand repeat protein [Clostridia bacterium]
MKKGTKVWLIIAGIAFALGIILMVCGVAVSGFDFRNLRAPETELTEYVIAESFDSIKTDILDCDILIYPSADDQCTVKCVDSKNMEHSVFVSDGKLIIEQHDTRRWYEHISFFTEKKYIRIDLPKTQFDEFYLKTVSGDIYISDEFIIKGLNLNTTSGDLKLGNISADSIQCTTKSGDLKVGNISADSIQCTTTSGDIEAKDISCIGDITLKVTSGDIDLSNTVSKGKLQIKTVSGDIELDRCDGAELSLKTTSGDIEATLLSGKTFDADATTGDVRVSSSQSGAGKCVARTTSGDIEIRVLD